MVKIRFECGSEERMSPEYGPYEYLQATYSGIRTPDEGRDPEIAWWDAEAGDWLCVIDGKHYSDFVIFSEVKK